MSVNYLSTCSQNCTFSLNVLEQEKKYLKCKIIVACYKLRKRYIYDTSEIHPSPQNDFLKWLFFSHLNWKVKF